MFRFGKGVALSSRSSADVVQHKMLWVVTWLLALVCTCMSVLELHPAYADAVSLPLDRMCLRNYLPFGDNEPNPSV